MAGSSRKSFGAVRFDESEFASPSTSKITPARKRRSIAVPRVIETNIEENDDEAERLARRERNEVGSPAASTPVSSASDRRQSTFGLSAVSHLSAAEMSNQIAQCIKLNAENKINDKNAFQLKMIDFLVYSLKKQDPNMTNLQMASASLDASAKIYGFRVDKVHSDLLKVIGMAKQSKKDHPDNEDNEDGDQLDAGENHPRRTKKKKSRQHIISTVDALKGKIETYDPLSLIRSQRDTQTSDMLFQAGMPVHANQGIALNLYNDVLLDQVPKNSKTSIKILSRTVEDISRCKICPSYAAFKFLDWSPDDEVEEDKSQDEPDGEYHFDLDAAVADDADDFSNDNMMDCGDAFEKRCDRLAQNRQPFQNIVDFEDIIANNPNPNATYEYSYMQKSCQINWAGPSHWKITMNKNFQGSRVVDNNKPKFSKKKKEIELAFSREEKIKALKKFEQIDNVNRQPKLSAKTMKLWSKDKVTFPQDVHYDLKRFNTFFNKPAEYIKFCGDDRIEPKVTEEDDDSLDISNFGSADDRDNFLEDNEDRFTQGHNPLLTQESVVAQSQGGFIGDNLVSVPKVTEKVFIPYSQRAKKIDMHQLKKAMWKQIKKSSKETEKENNDITQEPQTESNKEVKAKLFSDIYLKLPKMLPKRNADSLSPAVAFVSLLHLANEKNLKIDEMNMEDFKVRQTIDNEENTN